jgi:hypothetical protein
MHRLNAILEERDIWIREIIILLGMLSHVFGYLPIILILKFVGEIVWNQHVCSFCSSGDVGDEPHTQEMLVMNPTLLLCVVTSI